MAGIQPYAFEPSKRTGTFNNESEYENSSDSDGEMLGDMQPRVLNTEWCSCDYCRIMPSERESICCQEMSHLN